jgi:hypothetical protein
MFVTPKVFKLIGLSNDGRRHGRDTYLFFLKHIDALHVSHIEKSAKLFTTCINKTQIVRRQAATEPRRGRGIIGSVETIAIILTGMDWIPKPTFSFPIHLSQSKAHFDTLFQSNPFKSVQNQHPSFPIHSRNSKTNFLFSLSSQGDTCRQSCQWQRCASLRQMVDIVISFIGTNSIGRFRGGATLGGKQMVRGSP